MVQYSTKMIFAVLDVSLIMGLNIGETDKVFCINSLEVSINCYFIILMRVLCFNIQLWQDLRKEGAL